MKNIEQKLIDDGYQIIDNNNNLIFTIEGQYSNISILTLSSPGSFMIYNKIEWCLVYFREINTYLDKYGAIKQVGRNIKG